MAPPGHSLGSLPARSSRRWPRCSPFPLFFLSASQSYLRNRWSGDSGLVKPEPRRPPRAAALRAVRGAWRPAGPGPSAAATCPAAVTRGPATNPASTRQVPCGSQRPAVSPAQSPAGSVCGRGAPSPGPGGDTSAPRGQAGAGHPRGRCTPSVRLAQAPHRLHPTALLGKLAGSKGEQQSDQQSGCSTPRVPPSRGDKGTAQSPESPRPSPGDAGHAGYRGSRGALPAMPLAPGTTAGTVSLLQGSLREQHTYPVTHSTGGPPVPPRAVPQGPGRVTGRVTGYHWCLRTRGDTRVCVPQPLGRGSECKDTRPWGLCRWRVPSAAL